MHTVLVTGGAGFIGSNFVRMMVKKYPEYRIVNIDSLTYAGNLLNLSDIESYSNYIFIKADIRDRDTVGKVFDAYQIDSVVNFAAESHVDRSIEEPEIFLTTNIIGTQVLLDIAKKHWKLNSSDKYCREYKPDVKFIQISTDEVYGALGKEGLFTEDMPLKPNSPYSASKASADMIVRSYHETFGLPVNISRCSNNYGPFQFPEKLIPLVICNCMIGKSIPVYGDGMQIRDWLHVSDHCKAIDTILHKGISGEVYNIGGNNERANIEIVKLIIGLLNKSEALIQYVKDRPGHDRRYAINNTKLATTLGWKPEYVFENGLEDTVKWYLENDIWLNRILSGEYTKYYEKMYKGIQND